MYLRHNHDPDEAASWTGKIDAAKAAVWLMLILATLALWSSTLIVVMLLG